MQKADYWLRLMKQRTDALVASDEKLQQFLMWVSQKSHSVKAPYKPATVRAFYLERACFRACALDHHLDRHLDRALDLHLDLPLAFDDTLDLPLPLALALALDLPLDLVLDLAFDRAFDRTLAPELTEALQKLQVQLLKDLKDRAWWQVNGQVWTEQLRAVMIKHRNIGHDWQFSEQQKELLNQYHYANLLLVDCLNSNCDVTPAVRSHIEETLLLPIALIEKTGSCPSK